jgi:hypothetical protein
MPNVAPSAPNSLDTLAATMGKALTLQTVPVRTEQRKGDDLRPAIAERRLSLASNGNVIIALKTPYEDGTTGTPSLVCSEGGPTQSHGIHGAAGGVGPKPAAPKPRVNLTRFYGVFSRGGLPPTSRLRKDVVPQHPGEEQENPKPKACSRPGRHSDGRSGSSVYSVSKGPQSDREMREVWWTRW